MTKATIGWVAGLLVTAAACSSANPSASSASTPVPEAGFLRDAARMSDAAPNDAGELTVTVSPAGGPYPLIAHLSVNDASAAVHWEIDGTTVDTLPGSPLRHVFCKPGSYDVVAHAGQQSASAKVAVSDGLPTGVSADLRAAYADVAQRLCAEETRVQSYSRPNPKTLIAANLLTANSSAGPQALANATYRAANSKFLAALVAMGVSAITFEVDYPTLTAGYYGANGAAIVDSVLSFYDQTMAAARAAHLKVAVLHNDVLPGFSAGGLPDPAKYYAGLTKTEWGKERAAEVKLILDRIQPDFLALTTEPTTHSSGLALSASDWGLYASSVLSTVTPDEHARTRVGIGTGTWEPRAYFDQFASIAGLDFLEAHVYPLALPGTGQPLDQITEMESRWDEATAHGKVPMVLETWDYKMTPTELSGGVVNTTAFGRDTWQFVEPLDQLYLEVLARDAWHHGVGLVAPFWTQYFFAYVPYDATTSGLTSTELSQRAKQLAGQALPDGRTGTGLAWSRVASGAAL